MDTEDYSSSSYLKFLGENHHSYLLSNNEVELDALAVEPIFAEIDSSCWTTETLPVLLSGSLTTEDVTETSVEHENIQIFNKEQEKIDTVVDTCNKNVTEESKSTIDLSENVYLTSDVLLELNSLKTGSNSLLFSSNNGQLQKKTTYITYSSVPVQNVKRDKELNETLNQSFINNNGIIQLLDVDGTITTASLHNNTLLQSPEIKSEDNHTENLAEYYSSVTAFKCKFCDFLIEKDEEIQVHLKQKHATMILLNSKVAAENANKPTNGEIIVGTKMKSILNTNNNTKPKITLYLCSECKNGYKNKEDLKTHMIMVHNLKTDKNDKLQNNKKTDKKGESTEEERKSIKSLSQFLVKQQQKALKKVKCSIKGCNLRFAREEQRQRHEECHVGQEKKQFKCNVCEQKFSIWRICSNHMWKCHEIDLGLLTCPMCNTFKSNNPDRLLNHMAIHNDEKPFLCSQCGKSFKQITQLRNHEVLHKAPDELPNWSAMKQCEICERYFANSKSWKKHVQIVHDKFKPFICNICGHKTARKAMLELHLRQHTGAKPHKCNYCDYKTGDHNSLRRHVMRHDGVTKYSCPHCSYQSIQSSAYKNHLASRHPGKSGTYSCTFCSYTGVNAAAYLSHIKCHQINTSTQNAASAASKHKNSSTEESVSAKLIKEEIEDDETQNCFLNGDTSEDTVDTGGITIPAGAEMQLTSS